MEYISAFSGFSVTNIVAAKEFYVGKLGLELTSQSRGLEFSLPGGGTHFIYEKSDHTPAEYTVLNFVVSDIDASVDMLTKAGVKFERYEGMHQDEKGIARGKSADQGPDIAWFTDPAGNILSVLQN